MDLCERCRNFDIHSFARGGPPFRGYPIGPFLRAAQSGCPFCSLLLKHFLVADAGDKLKFLSIEMRKRSGEWADVKWVSGEGFTLFWRCLMGAVVPVWVNFSVRRGEYLPSRGEGALNAVGLDVFVSPFTALNGVTSAYTHTIKLHLGADPGTPAATSQDITGRITTDRYTWSWSHLDAIATWHRECKKNHPECGKTLSRTQSFDVDDAPLPSRCMEVVYDPAYSTGPGVPPFRYFLRETAGMRGRYLALSHRWGDDTFKARTLRGNYECRAGRCPEGCSVECAPPTRLFVEAANLGLWLGVKYIWIDSWCIVQDDDEDWARESVRMADYYQYAWLVVSATTLTPEGGLFGELSPEDMPSITQLPYYDKEGNQRGHLYAQCVGEDTLAEDYVRHVSRSSLLRRGWVYQEWMLSRRLLSFSAAGLFVQCQNAAPKGIAGDAVRRGAAGGEGLRGDEPEGYNDLAFKSLLGFALESVREVRESWLTAVETYSGLEITYLEADRLIALAGVAKEFGIALAKREGEDGKGKGVARCKHRYVSGLWFGHVRGLLWEQVTDGPRVRVQGLPSWSWASIAALMKDGKGGEVQTGMAVQWAKMTRPYDKPEDVCEMVEARTVPVNVSVGEHGDTVMTPLFEEATAEPPESEYRKDHRFVMLGMKARLMRVRVHGEFHSEDDTKAAAVLTAHSPDFGRDMWRRVTTESDVNTVVGWASIEHPVWQHHADDSEAHQNEGLSPQLIAQGQIAHALFVSRIGRVKGGLGYGNWTGYQIAFKVLYVQPVDIPGFGTGYERVGTGRLFGNDVDAAFQGLRDTGDTVWLV